MTEYHCTDCDWSADVDATETPPQYCPACGKPTSVTPEYQSLGPAETKTDKI